MSITRWGGLGGFGFVLVAVVINVIYVRAGLPLPVAGKRLDEVTDEFATVGDALKLPSTIAPAAWLFTTVFAAACCRYWGGAELATARGRWLASPEC